MKIASYALMAIGILTASYAGYSLWFAKGDWLELGLGTGGAVMTIAGIMVKRIADQATSRG